jgi:phosphoglycolate phosphatase
MPVKLIIFDLDGTLVDSSVDITNALNYALEPYLLQRLTVDDTIKLVGEGITRLIEKAMGDRDAAVVDSATERFLQHYTQHILDNTIYYPGVKETLEKLGRFKKAVISNKKENLSRMILEGLHLLQYFDVVIGSDSAPEKKPSPIPVLKALSDLHIEPASAVIVGDSNYDIDAGKAASVTTIAVTYGYKPREVIAHADYLIDRMTDLVPLIERMNTR